MSLDCGLVLLAVTYFMFLGGSSIPLLFLREERNPASVFARFRHFWQLAAGLYQYCMWSPSKLGFIQMFKCSNACCATRSPLIAAEYM